jgi:hypothetical protein
MLDKAGLADKLAGCRTSSLSDIKPLLEMTDADRYHYAA